MAYTDIDKPSDYFNTVLYTGDASSPRTISGVGFQPDWNWSKSRNSADYDHNVADSVRGGSAYYLKTNTAAAETGNPAAGYVSSFNSDGYVLTAGGGDNTNYNNNNTTYVSWNWKAGTSFTNDASGTGIGSIDSTGSVNTDAGFSIVSYTGTGSTGTVAHGLGVAPSMLIYKNRASTDSWNVQHDGLTSYDYYVRLNSTGAQNNDIDVGPTAPTSTVVTVGSHAQQNGDGNAMILYAFAEKQGYSKFGSYTGNGAASDGTFSYTGFKPTFIILKSTGVNDWRIIDNKRSLSGGSNPIDKYFYAQSSAAEGASSTNGVPDQIDFLSNGFKIRQASAGINGSGQKYIYMAFAENPFVTSSGVPATAR